MRILAAADLHGSQEVYEWLVALAAEIDPDAIVLAGDLLGVPDGYDSVEAAQEADRSRVIGHFAKIGQPILYLMGNDDWIELDAPLNHHQSIHGRRVDLGNFNFVGYQYTLPFMGGVNEKPEACIKEDLALLAARVDEQTILVTHGPAYGILDRGILDRRAGSVSLVELIARRPFRAHIHGHIHNEFGREGSHFNVASAGKKRAIMIDVLKMLHTVLENDVLA